MRLQQHCASFPHSLQHYCQSFFNNKCLITYSCTLFVQIKMKKKKKKLAASLRFDEQWLQAPSRKKGDDGLCWQLLDWWDASQPSRPDTCARFVFTQADTRRLLQGWWWCSLKKKKKRRDQCSWHSVHDGNVKCGWRPGATCPAGCEAAFRDYDDSLSFKINRPER